MSIPPKPEQPGDQRDVLRETADVAQELVDAGRNEDACRLVLEALGPAIEDAIGWRFPLPLRPLPLRELGQR